jgi:tetratricopeptide (TPR) repeat protein
MISESLAIHRQIGDPRRLAKTLMTASGIARYHLLAYDKAFDHLKEAYAISKRGEELVGMADAQEQIGFLSWYLGEFDTALEAFEEAFDLAQRAGSRYEATIEHVNIGLTQAYRGQFAQAEVLIREGMKIDQLVDPHTQIVLLFVLIHLGHYEEVRGGARKIIESDFDRGRPWALRLLSWDALARNSNIEALAYGQRSVDAIESVFIPTQERKAWSQVPLGLAFHRQGQIVKAKSTLYEALQICVKIRAFLPMMHLLPVITVVLAEEDNNHSKEMAVELYTAARQIPFIENSQLFKTISEPYIQEAARQLPQEDLQAAEARGELLKSREIAETLLKGLEMFGWNKMSDAF